MPPTRVVETDERAARRSLRDQIARLERDLAHTFAGAYPRTGLEWGVPAMAGPRVLGLGELERLRDDLAARLRGARGDLARRTEREEECRRLIERMMLDPGSHRHVRVSREDIGERGCGHWHVRPRMGLVGMLMGWWQVKLSSGCPLARGLSPPPSPAWEDEAVSAHRCRARRGRLPRRGPLRLRGPAAASGRARLGAASRWSSCASCWRS